MESAGQNRRKTEGFLDFSHNKRRRISFLVQQNHEGLKETYQFGRDKDMHHPCHTGLCTDLRKFFPI